MDRLVQKLRKLWNLFDPFLHLERKRQRDLRLPFSVDGVLLRHSFDVCDQLNHINLLLVYKVPDHRDLLSRGYPVIVDSTATMLQVVKSSCPQRLHLASRNRVRSLDT